MSWLAIALCHSSESVPVATVLMAIVALAGCDSAPEGGASCVGGGVVPLVEPRGGVGVGVP